MTSYTVFNKATLDTLRAELNEVLAKYGMEAGLEAAVKNIKFTDNEADIGIKIKIAGALTRDQEMVIMMAKQRGFKMKGKDGAELTDYKMSNHKFPWIFTRAGKSWKANDVQAARIFGA